MTPPTSNTFRFAVALWVAGWLWLAAGVASAESLSVHHYFRLSLAPDDHEMTAVDRITFKGNSTTWPVLNLTGQARNITATVDGRAVNYTFNDGRLTLAEPGLQSTRILEIGYTCTFNDPIPVSPANSDNPTYGVTASISKQGTFLLAGAAWYPEVQGAQSVYRLEVDAPAGILAVTAGRLIGHVTRAGRTVSRWHVARPVEGLALSAGPYQVRWKDVVGCRVMTYFFNDSASLSEKYLEAAGRYLALYKNLFGRYPFEKFAVVENFFPTGYGFPSYTLLGSTVLRLPFIIHTSLPHEIAHNWWGNGVLVDYRQGNWCEGLTTYVSDYYLKERVSAVRALRYRLQMMRSYTTLVSPSQDFPLSKFKSRVDPATRAIGYDKSAMVFHMLRKKMGDQNFWQALRDIVRRRLFLPTTWTGLRDIFQDHCRRQLGAFFDQWVFHKGAPLLAIDKPSATLVDGYWQVRGQLTQAAPVFDLDLEAVLENEGPRQVETIHLAARQSSFDIKTASKPRRLAIDPDVNIFRRLHATELPPVVNSIKGAPQVSVVLLAPSQARLKAVSETLIEALGLKRVRMVPVTRLSIEKLPAVDVIVVGKPRKLMALLPKNYPLALDGGGFKVAGTFYRADEQSLFAVVPHPREKNRIMALFCPGSASAAQMVARKITHYGRYSYLVFTAGRLEKRGTWPMTASPLIYRWPQRPQATFNSE